MSVRAAAAEGGREDGAIGIRYAQIGRSVGPSVGEGNSLAFQRHLSGTAQREKREYAYVHQSRNRIGPGLCIQKYINRDHKSLSIGSSTASNSTEIVPAQALGLQSPLLTLSGMNQQSGWLHY